MVRGANGLNITIVDTKGVKLKKERAINLLAPASFVNIQHIPRSDKQIRERLVMSARKQSERKLRRGLLSIVMVCASGMLKV